MNCARQTMTEQQVLVLFAAWSPVVVSGRLYPGTREGVILVVTAPPDGTSRRSELADFLRRRREALQARRRRAPERRPAAHARPAPRGGRRARRGGHHLVHVARAGPRRARLAVGARVAGRGAADERRRALAPDAARAAATRSRRCRRAPRRSTRRSSGWSRTSGRARPASSAGAGTTWPGTARSRVVFCDPLKYPEGRRNQLWSMFMDPERRRRSTDWEAGARAALARFRADNARHLGDPDFEELIEDLRESSEEFRCWWKRHEVARSGTGAQGAQASGARQALVRARGLQARGEPRAAADPLLAAAEVQHAGEARAAAGREGRGERGEGRLEADGALGRARPCGTRRS